jgi:hypothetical protein
LGIVWASTWWKGFGVGNCKGLWFINMEEQVVNRQGMGGMLCCIDSCGWCMRVRMVDRQ